MTFLKCLGKFCSLDMSICDHTSFLGDCNGLSNYSIGGDAKFKRLVKWHLLGFSGVKTHFLLVSIMNCCDISLTFLINLSVLASSRISE